MTHLVPYVGAYAPVMQTALSAAENETCVLVHGILLHGFPHVHYPARTRVTRPGQPPQAARSDGGGQCRASTGRCGSRRAHGPARAAGQAVARRPAQLLVRWPRRAGLGSGPAAAAPGPGPDRRAGRRPARWRSGWTGPAGWPEGGRGRGLGVWRGTGR